MKIKSVTINSSNYPPRLVNIHSKPKKLFFLGNESLLTDKTPLIAVVGSRKATSYGKYVTETVVGELASLGINIISGLALGIDGLSHKATLGKPGKTIAVLPCGLDKIYPATHRGLAKDILKDGGLLISEYPVGMEALVPHFPARNRIVSGMAEGVLIIEAAQKSGSLITANFALEQGKTVMAVPGNINNPLSVGTNNLIKIGAHPISSAQDVLDVCGLKIKNKANSSLQADNENERIIIDLLEVGPLSGDDLQRQTSLSASDFNQTLTMLELRGIVKNIGSNTWTL